MPVADGRSGFRNRDRGAHAHEDDGGGGHGDRCSGMKHDAERAVVGVAIRGVNVGDLDESKECQQNEAGRGGGEREGTRPNPLPAQTCDRGLEEPGAGAAFWLELEQMLLRAFRIHWFGCKDEGMVTYGLQALLGMRKRDGQRVRLCVV